jgi:hypothetical protein
VSATFNQREAAAEVLRADGTQVATARAARVALSTLKRWLRDPSFQALIASSPDIRTGLPLGLADEGGVLVSKQDLRCRMWLASDGAVLGSYLPPAAFESAGGVLHLHRVEPGAVESVVASIAAGTFPADSRYIPVPLEGLNELLENLPLVLRLASPDARESLAAWLEVWMFIDEEGRTRRLAESLWQGQRRFLEALLGEGHVLSIKSRKVGLSTLVCAHAAWTARIRDRNASVHLLSYREDAAQELLRNLRRGFEGLPAFLRLPVMRETSTVVSFAAGASDMRTLKVFPATQNAAIESTCSHLVLDEWAHTFDPEAIWAALEPTLPPRATSALITTARAPDDFVHEYYLRSERGETRHRAVFVSALERSDRSLAWYEEKLRQGGMQQTLRNYPLTAEEAFAHSSEPYFPSDLLEAAQQDALPPSPARRGDRYLKAWDIGRKDASVCVVLRAPAKDEVQVWQVVGFERLVGEDFPAIQRAIESMHYQYPGPTVIEANSIGMPLIQNLGLAKEELIEYTTTHDSKQAMLTEIELHLQQQTLKIHRDFQQLLAELADYRLPDRSITQDSVIALGLAVANAAHAHALTGGGRINHELFRALNLGTSSGPSWWLDQQKLTTDGPSYGHVPLVREVSDPRELSRYQADALTGELEAMLKQGWTVENPALLEKLGLRLDAQGQLIRS